MNKKMDWESISWWSYARRFYRKWGNMHTNSSHSMFVSWNAPCSWNPLSIFNVSPFPYWDIARLLKSSINQLLIELIEIVANWLFAMRGNVSRTEFKTVEIISIVPFLLFAHTRNSIQFKLPLHTLKCLFWQLNVGVDERRTMRKEKSHGRMEPNWVKMCANVIN